MPIERYIQVFWRLWKRAEDEWNPRDISHFSCGVSTACGNARISVKVCPKATLTPYGTIGSDSFITPQEAPSPPNRQHDFSSHDHR